MLTIAIILALFCVTDTTILRKAANSEYLEDLITLLRKCCAGDDVVSAEFEDECHVGFGGPANITFTSLSDFFNSSTLLCCATCFREAGEKNASRSTVDNEENLQLSCFEACSGNRWSTGGKKNDSSFGNFQVHGRNKEKEVSRGCDSVLNSLNFWGANIVIFANMIYIAPYLIVIFVFWAVPSLRTRAYDRAVICFNVSQVALNGILIGIGLCVLCHVPIYYPAIYSTLGLMIMFLTISSTFWLFVICFDMTLAITKFRWAPAGDHSRQDEKKKFLIYAAWTWGGALLPTAFACIVEFSPFIPKSSPLRPNFDKFDDGANVAVIIYVATLPAVACITNTVLFFYTSYKMILIRRATAIASASSTASTENKKIKKKYIVFVKLYLLMDSPWLSSALGAIFTDLWLLKFFRMVQPILMLLAILPPGTISNVFKHCFRKQANPT